MEKGDRDHHSQDQAGVPLDWRYGNPMDSFCPAPWDQATNAHMNFFESNAARPDLCWNPTFMEMATMPGHFAMNSAFDSYSNPPGPASQLQRNGVSIREGPSDSMAASVDQEMQDSGNLVGISGNESSETMPGGGGEDKPPPSKAFNAKKRKMSAKENGKNQLKEESEDGDGSKHNAEHGTSTLPTVKHNGKSEKEKEGSPKGDYIHIRARRGQATNSHSLAERVRREKISERMKLLQDLVPGCSKVTGKAVMLDEIINYVQSLQRQVEFLSMKLAAINPQLNFNVERLLSKDILQSHAGPSTTGFSNDMLHPLLHQNLHDLIHSGNFGVASPPDALRRAVDAQMTAMAVLKESKPQMPMTWSGELHNGMQMNFVGNQPLNIQDLNAKSQDGFPI